MKTTAIITLTEDDYYLLLYLLGIGTGQALKCEDRTQADRFKASYDKITESVIFTEDHEK